MAENWHFQKGAEERERERWTGLEERVIPLCRTKQNNLGEVRCGSVG